MNQLNWYDMEARNYMPDIGRWGNMDKLAESFFVLSPYNFSNNNPVYFSDSSGLSPDGPKEAIASTIIRNGRVIEHRNDGDPGIYLADFGWKVGDSTNNLPLLGFEKPGQNYNVGNRVMIDIVSGYGLVGEQRRANGATEEMNFSSPVFMWGWLFKGLSFFGGSVGKVLNIEGAVWAQTTFSKTFSTGGKFAGQAVDDVASSLASGTLQVSEVPVNVIVRNGKTFILNTRSSAALTKAGIPRSAWNVVNQTGVANFENMLTNQLVRNGIPNGTNIIKSGATLIKN